MSPSPASDGPPGFAGTWRNVLPKRGGRLTPVRRIWNEGCFFIPFFFFLFWGGGWGVGGRGQRGTRGNVSTLFLSHEPGAAKMSSFQRCLFCNQFSLSLLLTQATFVPYVSHLEMSSRQAKNRSVVNGFWMLMSVLEKTYFLLSFLCFRFFKGVEVWKETFVVHGRKFF